MRVVQKPADLASMLEEARREAGAAFGNDAVFLERYIRRAKHIEVQILGDRHGNVCICMSAIARCSAAIRKWSKSRRPWALDAEHPQGTVRGRGGAGARAASTTTPARSNFWWTPTRTNGFSSK